MSLPLSPYTLRELVAGNLRRLRNVTSAEPEDVVRAARQFGLEWTAAWYSAAERGQKPLSAEHLLALPPVLTAAFAYRVSLSDLLLGDGSIHLGQPIEGTTLSLHYLRELVTAEPFRRSFLDDLEAPAVDEAPVALAAAQKMREIVSAGLGDVDVRALARAEAGTGDAEAKLAKKLEVPEIVVIAAAASLWGRSMTEEQEAQLNPEEGDPPSAASVRRKLTNSIKQKITDAAETAQSKAAAVAASTSVTAEFPLVRPNQPTPPPVEWASGSRQWRILPTQRRTAPQDPAPQDNTPEDHPQDHPDTMLALPAAPEPNGHHHHPALEAAPAE